MLNSSLLINKSLAGWLNMHLFLLFIWFSDDTAEVLFLASGGEEIDCLDFVDATVGVIQQSKRLGVGGGV